MKQLLQDYLSALIMAEETSDSQKWQQHLALLREQYVNLYNSYTELQQKHALATSSNEDHGFIRRLLSQISMLYKEQRYSDVIVELRDRNIPVHKFVLAARSDSWSALPEKAVLDWKNLDENVGLVLLKWIYTDVINQDQLTIDLMKAASAFGLAELVDRCEKYLIGSVKLQDCVRLYTISEELGAKKLRDHCSSLISCHWDDLTGEDFKEMSGPLLYQLLKAKSEYPLHSAVRLQREDVVFLYLVEHNAELPEAVNTLDRSGKTALEVALKSRQPSLARTLVEHRADLCAKDAQGHSLLHSAILNADSYAAEFIVEQLENGDGSARVLDRPDDTDGKTALHLLAVHTSSNMLAVAGRLLNAGVGPNAQSHHGWSPLHCCVSKRNESLLKLLLLAPGVEVDLRTHQGDTALCMALLSSPSFEAGASRLLICGASPNPRYPGNELDTLLHRLAREGREEAALFLLEPCDDKDPGSKNKWRAETDSLEVRNRGGWTTLHEAARSGLPRLCRRLLERCPGLVSSRTLAGDTCFHLAVGYGKLQALRSLLDCSDVLGPEMLAVKNADADSPLSLALGRGERDFLAALVEAGADLELRNEAGHTALQQAILKEDSASAIFLLEHGADMNARSATGETSLQLSVHCHLGDVVEALCRRGADASAGCPLWDALESEQEDVASSLIAYGADPDCWGLGPDGCRQSLLHRAIDENREDIAQFLVRSGCDLNAPRRPGLEGAGGEESRDECTPLHLCCQWGLEQIITR